MLQLHEQTPDRALDRVTEAANSEQARQFFSHFVEVLNPYDLQEGTITARSIERDALAYQLVIEEALELAEHSQGRAFGRLEPGSYTQFATRIKDTNKMDAFYRVGMTESGEGTLWAESRLEGRLDSPIRVTAQDGTVQVAAVGWKRAPYEIPRALGADGPGQRLLLGFVGSLMLANNYAQTRTPEVRAESDAAARMLALKKIRGEFVA